MKLNTMFPQFTAFLKAVPFFVLMKAGDLNYGVIRYLRKRQLAIDRMTNHMDPTFYND